MHELVRTNNAVLISAIGALLDEAGIPYVVLDQNMPAMNGTSENITRYAIAAACCDPW